MCFIWMTSNTFLTFSQACFHHVLIKQHRQTSSCVWFARVCEVLWRMYVLLWSTSRQHAFVLFKNVLTFVCIIGELKWATETMYGCVFVLWECAHTHTHHTKPPFKPFHWSVDLYLKWKEGWINMQGHILLMDILVIMCLCVRTRKPHSSVWQKGKCARQH